MSGYKLGSIGIVLYISVFKGTVIYAEVLWNVCCFGMFGYFWHVGYPQSFRKSGARPQPNVLFLQLWLYLGMLVMLGFLDFNHM